MTEWENELYKLPVNILSDLGPFFENNIKFKEYAKVNSFDKLNKKYIEQLYSDFVRTRVWFSNEKVKTVNKVFDELNKFYLMINDRFQIINAKELSNYHVRVQKIINNKNSYEKIPKFKINEEVKQLFADIVYEAAKTVRFAKNNLLESNEKIEDFIYLTETLSSNLRLKSNHLFIRRNQVVIDAKTDEELVAHALYLSQYKKEETVIVTKDGDIESLIAGAYFVIPNFDTTKLKVYNPSKEKPFLLDSVEDYKLQESIIYSNNGFKKAKLIKEQVELAVYNVMFTTGQPLRKSI